MKPADKKAKTMNIRTEAVKRHKARMAEQKSEAQKQYIKVIVRAAATLFEHNDTTLITLSAGVLEDSPLVAFIVMMWGNEQPLASENRRYNKVANDIRETFMEMRNDARNQELARQHA